jgi:hypothetical protein
MIEPISHWRTGKNPFAHFADSFAAFAVKPC